MFGPHTEANYLVDDKQDEQLIDRCLRLLESSVKVETTTQQNGENGGSVNKFPINITSRSSSSRLERLFREPLFSPTRLHHYHELTEPSNGNGCNPGAKSLSGEAIIAARRPGLEKGHAAIIHRLSVGVTVSQAAVQARLGCPRCPWGKTLPAPSQFPLVQWP